MPQDPFAQLLRQQVSDLQARGEYKPVVGYLYADGSVEKFSSDVYAWLSFERAVSTCFGSAAKRLRGTKGHARGDITAILMLVMDSDRTIVWRCSAEFPTHLPDFQTGGYR